MIISKKLIFDYQVFVNPANKQNFLPDVMQIRILKFNCKQDPERNQTLSLWIHSGLKVSKFRLRPAVSVTVAYNCEMADVELIVYAFSDL